MFGSAQMSIIPAKVAGVETVVGCTPPVKGEGYFPATINAMKQAGADRIFIVGGVPAFALMAFGMGEVEPVDMLCGAGNKFVVEAKRQLFGQCGIDLLPGPTEIAIIADDSADPFLVACDISNFYDRLNIHRLNSVLLTIGAPGWVAGSWSSQSGPATVT